MTSIERLLIGQPHDYYCITSKSNGVDKLLMPEMVTGGKRIYVDREIRIFSSQSAAKNACKKDEDILLLICLGCFLNIMRSNLNVNKIILNNQFTCDVVAWRTPCQTTAIFKYNNDEYYMEGCRESGVFCKPTSQNADTPPPFVICGAEGLDCIWESCPHGWSYFDDESITLCHVSDIADCNKEDDFIIRVDFNGTHFYYAGVNQGGIDFTQNLDLVSGLEYLYARRIAIAIANIQIQWSKGMLAEVDELLIAIQDINGNDIMHITRK